MHCYGFSYNIGIVWVTLYASHFQRQAVAVADPGIKFGRGTWRAWEREPITGVWGRAPSGVQEHSEFQVCPLIFPKILHFGQIFRQNFPDFLAAHNLGGGDNYPLPWRHWFCMRLLKITNRMDCRVLVRTTTRWFVLLYLGVKLTSCKSSMSFSASMDSRWSLGYRATRQVTTSRRCWHSSEATEPVDCSLSQYICTLWFWNTLTFKHCGTLKYRPFLDIFYYYRTQVLSPV